MPIISLIDQIEPTIIASSTAKTASETTVALNQLGVFSVLRSQSTAKESGAAINSYDDDIVIGAIDVAAEVHRVPVVHQVVGAAAEQQGAGGPEHLVDEQVQFLVGCGELEVAVGVGHAAVQGSGG